MRIALVHATPVAVYPIRHAFQRVWPEVVTGNMFDYFLPAVRDVT